MKRQEQDQLLKELLTDDEMSAFRQASLEGGIAFVRRKRRRQRAVRLSALACAVLLCASGILLNRVIDRADRQIAGSGSPAIQSPSSPPEAAAVKFISDEELFALFPDRAMALIGKPGQQQVVFLDARARLLHAKPKSVHN